MLDRSLDPTLPPFGDAPTAKPADTSMRFGSAASPDIGPTPLDQQEAQNPDLTPSVPRPASATPSPPPHVDQPGTAEAGSPGLRDGTNERSAGGDHTRIANRQVEHRNKARLKHHTPKVSEIRWVVRRALQKPAENGLASNSGANQRNWR